MKLKEKMKRFLSLDVHGHEGFTLVELIIVIAILAILSGVAIAGYSSYITKANKQADQTMIADLKNALTLAYYSGDLTGSGVIILSTNGVENTAKISENEALTKVLTDAYGSNWATSLKLKYSDWPNSAAFSTLTQEAAVYVTNSSYVTGSSATELMGTVSSLTDSVVSALGNGASVLDNLTDEAKEAVMSNMGITEDDVDGFTSTQLANFALLAVAYEMSNEENDMGTLSDLVSGYATWSGYAYSDYASAEEKEAYDALNETLSNAPSSDELVEYNNSYLEWAFAKLTAFEGSLNDEQATEYMKNANETDAYAIESMMAALNAGSSNLTTKDLADSSLAADGVLGDYFNQYLDAAQVVSSFGEFVINDGQVAVCFSFAGEIIVYSSID